MKDVGGGRTGGGRSRRRWWSIAGIAVLVIALAALIGIGGCGDGNESMESVPTTIAAAIESTAVPATASGADEGYGAPAYDVKQGYAAGAAADTAATGSLTALQASAGQKVISDAQLEIEIESGRFEAVFDQALLLADRYGGYVVSSGSQASRNEETEGMKSGTITIRVPATSFTRALADAAKLGEVKNRQVQTQDVTEEYVDLQARIANSEAHVQVLLALLGKAKTVDEILQVRQVLTVAQQELEQLKGRLRYLDEHTNYSTLTLFLYESGAEPVVPTEWGFAKALKDALHNLVGAVNAIVRGLGVLVPVLVVLAIVGLIVYVVWSRVARRHRQREKRRYQPYPQGGERYPGAGPGATACTGEVTPTATGGVEAPPPGSGPSSIG